MYLLKAKKVNYGMLWWDLTSHKTILIINSCNLAKPGSQEIIQTWDMQNEMYILTYLC